MSDLVHVYWDGNTGGIGRPPGGWHACTDAEWFSIGPNGVGAERMPAYRVTLGRLFIDDHLGRDLPFGLVVSENQRTYTLLMTVDDIRELYSDASHYGDGGMDEWYERENRDVVQAARRVMAGLEKQVPDQLK